jgi:hypothetical protein
MAGQHGDDLFCDVCNLATHKSVVKELSIITMELSAMGYLKVANVP